MGIDVALAVVDDGDHARLRQHLLGLRGGAEPARRLAVLQGALAMGYLDVARARPQPTAGKPKTAPIVGVDRQHGMQEHAVSIAFADLAQAAAMLRCGGELDLAGVLDRQHVTIATGNPRLVAPALDQ